MSVIARYRALSGGRIVIQREGEAVPQLVATAYTPTDAEYIADVLTNHQGAVERIKGLCLAVNPKDSDEREAAYARGYLAAVSDALETIVGGQ